MRTRLVALALALWPAACATAEPACRDLTFEGTRYSLCEAQAGDDIRLFQTAPDGKPYGSFERINSALVPEGRQLAFAMNAGMYHADRRPVGLLVEEGFERAPIVTSAGPGNFGMLPNGVFCVGEGYRVIESRAFAAERPACRFASQSGPMLVIGGKLHPRFLVDSDSRYVRNGVGVSADGSRAVFAISNRPVTFHEFGRLFRDALELPDALYFDGSISRLYDRGARRSDWGTPMGPIVGLVVPTP
ncbi:phosphodiester glycosidase family protein [Cereibacter azotoformans]|uniref:phosphodiester glycosidase family protein n=1 Tax=Cereibacter azotoformans TaxID=43057 RepID=UPI003B22765D